MADREKLIELIAEAPGRGLYSAGRLADHLIANGVTVKVKKPKPEVCLLGKCGSCKHSVPAVGVFGDSKCYVRCTNEEHLSSRCYQERPLMAVRQRTAKACKLYDKEG